MQPPLPRVSNTGLLARLSEWRTATDGIDGRGGSVAARGTDLWPLAGLALLAFVVRLLPVLRGGGLLGLIDYDDGVYFGSAIALVHGRLPYGDFLLLHPPGILYVLTPFAALGSIVGDGTAFGIARVSFMALGAANTVLVWLVARRLGRLEAICAAALYAVWEVPAIAERSTWLIAPQNALLLLALLALAPSASRLGRKRAALAGAMLGLALAIQLWSVFTIAVLGAWVFVSTAEVDNRWAIRAAYLVGVLFAFSAAVLPFVVIAGPQLVQYTVFDQFGRTATETIRPLARLRGLEGLPYKGPAAARVPALIVASAFLVGTAAVGLGALLRPRIRLWTTLLAVQTAVLLTAPTFFGHYPAWLAPAASLSVGGTAATFIHLVGARRRRGGAVGYGLGLAVLVAISTVHPEASPFPATEVADALAGARCVTADSPVLLILTGTLRRDIERGCPLIIDTSGTSFDTDRAMPGSLRDRADQPEYQAAMKAYYGGADAVLFMRLAADKLSTTTLAAIRDRLPVQIRHQFFVILLRPGA